MRVVTLLCAAALAGCTGNWSTDDLVFASVLPWTADLVVTVPTAASSQPLEGVATREAPLMVGDPSVAWAQTRKAAGDFNALLIQLLGFVEQVRLVAPSARSAESRTWGPYPDANNAGREVQLRVTRPVLDTVDEVFEWTLESRAGGGQFVRIISGDVTVGETARTGSGRFTVFVKDFRDLVKVTDALGQLDEIAVNYGNGVSPSFVRMMLVLKPGGSSTLSPLGYTTARAQSGAGSLFFVGPAEESGRQVAWRSRWNANGAGRAEGELLADGGVVTECWTREGVVSHYAESWDGGTSSGNAAECVVVEGL